MKERQKTCGEIKEDECRERVRKKGSKEETEKKERTEKGSKEERKKGLLLDPACIPPCISSQKLQRNVIIQRKDIEQVYFLFYLQTSPRTIWQERSHRTIVPITRLLNIKKKKKKKKEKEKNNNNNNNNNNNKTK